MSQSYQPIVLCILDGWGDAPDGDDNAISRADTPHWDALTQTGLRSQLLTSGREVGLPEGQMGNSEVGHMNIGCGRVVLQDLPRIDKAVTDGSLAQNSRLKTFIDALKRSGGAAHLGGLLSPGGVHAHQRHIAALARVIDEAGVPVAIHAFLDGRDTPPQSAADYLAELEREMAPLSNVKVASVLGRYYAMDRDQRWDRVEQAWRAIVRAEGTRFASTAQAIDTSYANKVTDEFVIPAVIGDYAGVKEGDGWLMANFRADRARELSHALLDDAFDGFARPSMPGWAAAAAMTEYSTELAQQYAILFPPEELDNSLGEMVAKAGLRQLRIAETEKYAHVTFFLNGGREEEFDGEERIMVPSPKVATYDQKPEMAASEVTDQLVHAVHSGNYALIVVNYANTDMVGHTGDLTAAIKAVEAVDQCLGRLHQAVSEAGGALLVTADHGNAEMMRNPETGQPHTAHTTGPVPCLLVARGLEGGALEDGKLADLAPTILQLMGLSQPSVMTGRSLLTGTAAGLAA